MIRSRRPSAAGTPAPRGARPVRRDWHDLAEPAASPATFDSAMQTGLPEAARRWLGHAISPGTPMWRSVELSMRGEIRLGRWRSFTARQVLAPPDGYIWAATLGWTGFR